jgi:hypothetical protein
VTEIKVGSDDFERELLRPGGQKSCPQFRIEGAIVIIGQRSGPFDGGRVAIDVLAPCVQHAALVRERLRGAEPVPDVCVLRDDAQRDPFTATADQADGADERVAKHASF